MNLQNLALMKLNKHVIIIKNNKFIVEHSKKFSRFVALRVLKNNRLI